MEIFTVKKKKYFKAVRGLWVWGLSAWSFHILLVHAWILLGYSCFLTEINWCL